MALLKFNKAELVNLSYSLKREIISENKEGAYINTSIITCNTRRYHGLLALTLDRFGGDRYLLLSSLDESITVSGKQFNLGIHCYGDIYEPRGHKYVVDFTETPVPQITYKIGDIVFRKTLLLCPDRDQLLINYELLEAPETATVQFRPLLAFRNIHDLTHANDVADQGYKLCDHGASFRLYEAFPDLYLQFSGKARFRSDAHWYYGVTYSDEYRRGFDCREDLLSPGVFEVSLRPGDSIIFSAAKYEQKPSEFRKNFRKFYKEAGKPLSDHELLVRCAESLITCHNGRKKINAGLSWMYTGLLRETILALPGLTLYGNHPEDFEEILDNLIADEQERLFHRTTQVEAPLALAQTLIRYIDHGADEKAVWKKYGKTVKKVLESYLPGGRKEVVMHPNGLLWAQMDGVALSWMNAYVGGRAVTERAGYQVETNAFWYNAIRFALDMERKYASNKNFVKQWAPIAALIEANYQKTFWNEGRRCLADYVDNFGQNMDIRPNQLFAISLKYSAIEDELHPLILKVIDSELVTARGIRTLSPRDMKYKGVYEGSQLDRDLAYHQGSTRPWLLAPYIETCFRVKGPSFVKKAEWLTEGFFADLNKHGVGAFSELYDGDPPFEPHGAISSALSTAALLICESVLNKYKES